MTSLSLSSILPAPKNNGDSNQPSSSNDFLTEGDHDNVQLVEKSTWSIPPYGKRSGWRPKTLEDFGDGGAFPEIPVAQFPLDMGRKGAQKDKAGNTVALQVDAEGKIKYDAISYQGHAPGRIIQTEFKDLIPLRQRAGTGDLSLEPPSEEQIQETTAKTKQALQAIVEGKIKNASAKTLTSSGQAGQPTYVRYTPSSMMGETSDVRHRQRIVKMVDVAQDPLEPPRFKHTKVPRGPPSPPPPILRSPPRKLTAKDQEDWYIPPSVSNWKNPKGYTITLDKRVAADGRGLQSVEINDNFAKLSEALYTADRHAREEVRQRSQMQQKLAEKERAIKEDRLRKLAEQARLERTGSHDNRDTPRRERSHSQETSNSYSEHEDEGVDSEEDDEAARERMHLREERRRENERQIRLSRMGAEKRLKVLAREQNRDVSERIALGLAKPTLSGEAQFDSRLFNRDAGISSGFNEDQAYDKPFFSAQEAVQRIYKPSTDVNSYDTEEASTQELESLSNEQRFDVLGSAARGFQGSERNTAPREGPVQFEKEKDPFGVDEFLNGAIGEGSNNKNDRSSDSADHPKSKRPRTE